MKTFKLLSLLLVLHVFSCQMVTDEKKIAIPSNAFVAVPELLDRPEKLWQGEEWQTIQNRYGSARKKLQDPVGSLSPYLDLVEVYIHEARVTGEHGHYYPAALEVLEIVLHQENKTSDLRFRALSLKASVLLSQHDFQQALTIAQEALKLNQFNAQLYGILVDAHVELGDYKKAVVMADKMVNVRPDLRSYARISYLREIHGDVNGAMEAMKLALSAAYPGQEQTAWIRLRLAKLYVSTGQLEKAEKEYEQILVERENYPFAIAAKAELAVKRKAFRKAEALLLQACDIIPEVGFFEELAGVYQSLGQTEKVAKLIPEIMEMLEDDIQSGHNMNLEYAQLHLKLTKNYDQALNFALAEYHKRPENIDVNKTLALIYFSKKEFDKSQKHLDKASRTNAQTSELLCLKALLAIEQGNSDLGIKQLKQVFKTNPYQTHFLTKESKEKIS